MLTCYANVNKFDNKNVNIFHCLKGAIGQSASSRLAAYAIVSWLSILGRHYLSQ